MTGCRRRTCLGLLLPLMDTYAFVGPAVVTEGQPDRLCFPVRVPGTARMLKTVAELESAAPDGLLEGVVIPFNGVLVTRELVERIGLPREEFFIWGDDVEYLWRAKEAGARVATVTAARFSHPIVGDLGTPMMFGRTTYNHSPSDLKHYCMVRNNITNLRRYVGLLGVVAFLGEDGVVLHVHPAQPRPAAAVVLCRGRGVPPRLHRSSEVPDMSGGAQRPTVAIVIVTFNRADLLIRCLDGIAALSHVPDAVYVVNNASEDHTREVLDNRLDLPLIALHSEENLGGAGGFHRGVQAAYVGGYDRIWLMDDDVVPAPDCLEVLLDQPGPCLMAVREDLSGRLVEKAATKFDLGNPLAIRPKRSSVDTDYAGRADMPETVPVENVAFEGFMVSREVVAAVGLPDPAYFIFYDDVDFALRARRAGFPIVAVRDAVLVRQMDFDQQHDTQGWKGYYMYRNLFVVHFRYGENLLVRLKPYLIAAGASSLLSPMRGGRREAHNVWRAIRDARKVAHATLPPMANASPGGPGSPSEGR